MDCKPNVVNGGKRDFGSFHTSNVRELIDLADSDQYIPPSLPVEIPTFEEYKETKFQFGHKAKKKHYYLEEECTFLNHGAFGAVLKEALIYSQDWQRYIERQPLRFFDRQLFLNTVYVQKRLAEFVGCDTADITLVNNVTTATNSVLGSLDLTPDSTIYYLNTTYGAVKKNIKYLGEKTGAKMQEESLTFPIKNEEEILMLIDRTLNEGTTIAIFDHISSNHPFIMPVKKIVDLCHKRGVPVLIDGAHALGALPLNLRELGADFYSSNAHKWFCAAKGCGFLYVKRELQSSVHGLVVTHGFDSGFHSQFAWTGARDYTAYLSLHAIFNFWKRVGVDEIRKYCHNLLVKAIMLLQEKWDGETLAPLEMHGFLCCVSLPSSLYVNKPNLSYSDAEKIQDRLYHSYDIEIPVKCLENKLFVRVSAHIHNEMKDYAKLAHAVLEIVRDGE